MSKLPPNFDYQGTERCLGYIRGVTAIKCEACKTTGYVNNIVCDECGGYGDVPAPRKPDSLTQAKDEGVGVEDVVVAAAVIDSLG